MLMVGVAMPVLPEAVLGDPDCGLSVEVRVEEEEKVPPSPKSREGVAIAVAVESNGDAVWEFTPVLVLFELACNRDEWVGDRDTLAPGDKEVMGDAVG